MRGAVEAGQMGEAWGPSNKSYCSEIEQLKKKTNVRLYLHDFNFDRVFTACY
jgi:hypothetical protein